MSRRPAFGCALEILETLALTLVIFFVIQTFVAQPYEVQQLSMEQTLKPGHYVLVDKLTPHFDTYKRGDIVVFNPPEDWVDANGTAFIKRVIGVGGDTVEVEDGRVLVNGTIIEEAYVYREGGVPQDTEADPDLARWTVPEGELFLMGDHRKSSADSRTFGPVQVDNVIGRAWLRYWPLDTFGVLTTPLYPELASASP